MTAVPTQHGPTVSVVVPTIGRPSLAVLVAALAAGAGPLPSEVLLVDDRRDRSRPLELPATALPVRVLAGAAAGPAAARNIGWRAATGDWVAFLDDDVVPGPTWAADLAADLAEAGADTEIAGSQGRVRVPRPEGRRPTDWERNVSGLEGARWATADLAYRRDVLDEVGGFDERFPRAFREDADLGLRVTRAGYLIVGGDRTVDHPVRDAGPWISVRLQAGNRDDVLMRDLHGPGWRVAAGAEGGRTGRHLVTAAGALLAVGGSLAGRRRTAGAGTAVWLALTAELLAARVRPGPGTPVEVATMTATSAVLPLAATGHLVAGLLGLPGRRRDTGRAPLGQARSPLALSPRRLLAGRDQRPRSARTDPAWTPAAVLFDRDGTLVADIPANTDPGAVVPMPGARQAVARARSAGLSVGVVTNQAVIGRGTVDAGQVAAINRRVDQLVGPFDTWQVCPHLPTDACACRKPGPGLITAAAAALGVDPARCVVVGDVGTDLGAAAAAGARSVLVPTPVTRPEEVAGASVVAATVLDAVDLALAGMC